MRITQISVLAAAMAFAASASAGGHKTTAEKIQSMDTDGDGRVSQAEFTAKDGKTAADFARIDTNRDGFITAAEMDAHKAAKDAEKHSDGARHDGQHHAMPPTTPRQDPASPTQGQPPTTPMPDPASPMQGQPTVPPATPPTAPPARP